jgi:uncharacterized protein (TIGR00730 family)
LTIQKGNATIADILLRQRQGGTMNRVCVFCGSGAGTAKIYTEAAAELGSLLAAMEIELVYGGADIGLMGTVARAVLKGGGRVTGVIPRALVEKEIAFKGLDELLLVDTMHERKAMMSELSDGFIALPGGLGTLDEFVEVLTWAKLGIHDKPCGLLNVGGYYDRLLGFLDQMFDNGFISLKDREMVIVDQDPSTLLMKMNLSRPGRRGTSSV